GAGPFKPTPGVEKNRVVLRATAYSGHSLEDDNRAHHSEEKAPRVFRPHGKEFGPARTLAVERTALGVSACFGEGEASPVAKATWEELSRTLVERCRLLAAKDGPSRLIEPAFSPAGGVGLLVHRGMAAYTQAALYSLPPS